MPLNPRQQKFVEGYLAGKTAKRAYIDAGYKGRGNAAEVEGHRLLRNPKVAAVVESAIAKALTAADVTAERTVREVARLAFIDPRKLFRPDGTSKELHELDDDTAAAVRSVSVVRTTVQDGDKSTVSTTTRVKLWDKKGALELLMKHLGMLKDRVEVSGPGGVPVPIMVLKGVSVDEL